MSIKMQAKKKFQVVVLLFTAVAFTSLTMAGCGPAQGVRQPPPAGGEQSAPSPRAIEELQALPMSNNRITGLQINETPAAYEVVISANHMPDYTLAEPHFQLARVLYFPDAGLDLTVSEVEIDNDIIGPVKATELIDGGPSKIVIPILKPAPDYQVSRVGDNVIKVIFFKSMADQRPEEMEVAGEPLDTAMKPEEELIEKFQPVVAEPEKGPLLATTLYRVDVEDQPNLVDVKVVADGSIKIFKSFALPAPPRIVIDMAGINSPYEQEQRLAVDSPIVRQVRHFSHEEYLRLVIDVDSDYLDNYRAETVGNGLLVRVGDISASPREMVTARAAVEAQAEVQAEEKPTRQPLVPVKPRPAPARKPGMTAMVNAIDFIEEPGGRSTIQVGTTQAVDYEMVGMDDRHLRLHLKGADILSFRQRPLITTRFNSAVDVITPLQTEKMKEEGVSFVDIRLREKVPYAVEQDENLILIRFSPSRIAPDPAKSVVIPTEHALKTEEKEAVPPEPVSVTPSPEPVVAPPETAVTVVERVEAPERVMVSMAPEPQTITDTEIMDIFGPAPKKKYTGEPIALDFYKTDIRNVIRILKDVSGHNFAIDKDVAGSVTLSFINPVPWDQVLDLILEMNDLGLVERSGIIRISTRETIRRQKEVAKAELAADQALKKTEEELAPLVTEYFSISYSQAGTDILPHIQDLLTDRGHAKVDSRTNQVIMTDIPERIAKAREIIARIDKVTPQVMISARVVETTTNFSRELGADWGVHNRPGTFRTDMGGTYGYNVAMNNPAAAATNTMGINFARIIGTPFSLDAKLSLMETTGKVKIISSPRIVTLNNVMATISQGQEFPYQTVEDGNVQVEFKEAALKLEVTPQVTPDNRIALKIFIEEKEIGQARPGQEPPLNTKDARTELLVNDGDTVVIGGIIQQTERESVSGMPFFSKIPLLGHLFKTTGRSNEKTELMIFITPTVVRLD